MTRDEIIAVGLKYTKWQTASTYGLLYDLMERALPLRGDVVECGVALGGSAAIFGGVIAANPAYDRMLRLFDTFTGLPAPTAADGPRAQGKVGHCAGPMESVSAALHDVGLDHYSIVPGLVEETLRDEVASGLYPGTLISLLHIDVDWYEPTKACLELLVPKVVKGGFVIVDDYSHWEGCKKACDEWIAAHRQKGFTLNFLPGSPQAWWQVA